MRGRVPPLPPLAPARGGRLLRALGRAALAASSWRVDGAIPDLPRCVLIVAPHTSNWDFVFGFAAMLALDLRLTWLGKREIFVGPFGPLWRRFGGVPVDREAADGVVEAAAAELRPPRSTYVALSPEGTRHKVERWKSGFWRIARAAGVPILPVAFDYRARAVVIGAPVATSAEYAADLAALQRHFRAEMARHPLQY